MAESRRTASAAPTSAPSLESTPELGLDHALQALRDQGADRFDPVRFHFLEALARRSRPHAGAARRCLAGTLSRALLAYRERLEKAHGDGQAAITRPPPPRGAAQRENSTRRSPVAELTHYLAQQSPEDVGASVENALGARSELKALRYFRTTWSTLSVDQQLTRAIEHGPENAGPLNSHALVLRSLALMRDISPDYLKRFMSYADTLLWLDQVDQTNKPMAKRAAPVKTPGGRD